MAPHTEHGSTQMDPLQAWKASQSESKRQSLIISTLGSSVFPPDRRNNQVTCNTTLNRVTDIPGGIGKHMSCGLPSVSGGQWQPATPFRTRHSAPTPHFIVEQLELGRSTIIGPILVRPINIRNMRPRLYMFKIKAIQCWSTYWQNSHFFLIFFVKLVTTTILRSTLPLILAYYSKSSCTNLTFVVLSNKIYTVPPSERLTSHSPKWTTTVI